VNVYFITRNSLKTESSVLLDVKNYYNNSFELYYKIKRPLESLEVLVNMIALDMRFIDSIISMYNKFNYYDD